MKIIWKSENVQFTWFHKGTLRFGSSFKNLKVTSPPPRLTFIPADTLRVHVCARVCNICMYVLRIEETLDYVCDGLVRSTWLDFFCQKQDRELPLTKTAETLLHQKKNQFSTSVSVDIQCIAIEIFVTSFWRREERDRWSIGRN